MCINLIALSTASATTWYVDIGAPPEGNGASWQTAFQTIQPAIDAASTGDEVWVAEGTYAECRETISGALILREGISLYGGFEGNEISLEHRDWEEHPVIIDGEYALGGEAAQHVMILASDVHVDGFTIRGATDSGIIAADVSNIIIDNCRITENTGWRGGGLAIERVFQMVIENCVFENNSALKGDFHNEQYGGGLSVWDGVYIFIVGCTLRNNRATHGGGAFIAYGAVGLVDSIVEQNSALAYGGAVFLLGATSAGISHSFFSQNNAHYGGAIFYSGLGAVGHYPIDGPDISNCIFWQNNASWGGGICVDEYYAEHVMVEGEPYCKTPCDESDMFSFPYLVLCEPPINLYYDTVYIPPQITQCVFAQNTGTGGGGAILTWVPPDAIAGVPVANCIFWQNDTPVIESQGYTTDSWNIVTFSCLQDNSQLYSTMCVRNIVADPLFVDPDAGDFRLSPGSPCIDTGARFAPAHSFSSYDDIMYVRRGMDGDGLGTGTTGDGLDYDMGAYEYIPPGTLCSDYHTADTNRDYQIGLSELLRAIQLFNSLSFHCDLRGEDGFGLGTGDIYCCTHTSDYNPQDWQISLSELLRLVQFYNSAGYRYCPGEGSEDGFCPGVGAD
ncbi:MAG TPA: right-handed parallel beta-helix repeat-containing protein [Candidatus Hydrogenedentes bacterium]|nr:right-handed parallel beta-helix repeat-containing protein [Candidatus Hydrogenedentota bacterium]